MKRLLKVVLSILIVLVLIFAGGMIYITAGLDSTGKMAISNIGPSALEDGIYSGSYDGGRWSNQVDVHIKDHKIIKIDVVKDVAFSKPELTVQLFDRVIEEQNADIDVISGSTVTCKAYLKSIEDALDR